MSDKVQLTLSLSSEAVEVLNKHASERKRGEFISNLLATYGAQEGSISQVDIESMKLQQLGVASQLKTLDGRTTQIERQLAALIAKVGK